MSVLLAGDRDFNHVGSTLSHAIVILLFVCVIGEGVVVLVGGLRMDDESQCKAGREALLSS